MMSLIEYVIFSFYEKFVSHSTLTAVDVSDVLYRVRLLSFVPFFLCSVSLILLMGFDSINNMLFAAADVLSYRLPCYEVGAGKSARSLLVLWSEIVHLCIPNYPVSS